MARIITPKGKRKARLQRSRRRLIASAVLLGRMFGGWFSGGPGALLDPTSWRTWQGGGSASVTACECGNFVATEAKRGAGQALQVLNDWTKGDFSWNISITRWRCARIV